MDSENSYKLSSEDRDRIFEESILPLELFTHKPQQVPVAIFVGGQPGAGKTGLLEEIIANVPFAREDLFLINGDDFRPYHPFYRQLLREDDTLAASLIDSDIGSWIEKSLDVAKTERAHALVEGTLRDPEVTIGSAGRFTESGFTNELHVMVAHEFYSRLRIFNRYLDQREKYGFGRYTLLKAHNASYAALPASLETIMHSGQFRRIVLYDISRNVIYDSVLHGSENTQNILNIVNLERNSLHSSPTAILADIYGIRNIATQQHCNNLVLDDISRLEADVLKYIA